MTPWTAAHQASLSPTVSWSLPKFMPCISDAIQPSHPLLSSSPSDFNLSQHQGLFQVVSCSCQVAKVLALHSLCPQINGLFKVINAWNQWWCSVHFLVFICLPWLRASPWFFFFFFFLSWKGDLLLCLYWKYLLKVRGRLSQAPDRLLKEFRHEILL